MGGFCLVWCLDVIEPALHPFLVDGVVADPFLCIILQIVHVRALLCASFFNRHIAQLFNERLMVTARLNIVCCPNLTWRQAGLPDYFIHSVILADLNHIVAVVALLEHIPEVNREAVDILRLVEENLVVVGGVTVFYFHHTLFVDLIRERFVVDFARVGPTLNKVSPLADPFRTDQEVCKTAINLD